MATNFPTLSPMNLRDQADNLVGLAEGMAETIAQTPKMLAGSFPRNWKAHLRSTPGMVQSAVDKFLLDARLSGKLVEAIDAVNSVVAAKGLGSIGELQARIRNLV